VNKQVNYEAFLLADTDPKLTLSYRRNNQIKISRDKFEINMRLDFNKANLLNFLFSTFLYLNSEIIFILA
jgi:hypothetical protein